MARPFKCPYCKQTNTTWKGYRKTIEATKRIRICRNCNRRFTTKITIQDYNQTNQLSKN